MIAKKERIEERQSTAGGTVLYPFAPPPMPDVRPRCAWCHQPFMPVKPNQIYCSRYHSKKACERRKERLIHMLADFFASYGLQRHHIEDCVERWLERCQKVAKELGFIYDETEKDWRFVLKVV